jgi:hypothetical protein
MSTSSHRRRSSALRPAPEALEGRLLLSRVMRGTDIDGDTWTLRLVGPGDFRVTTQNDTSPRQPSLIKDITIAGGKATETRLVGVVRRGPSGDGRVFFQNLVALNSPPVPDNMFLIRLNEGDNGLLAVDMPNFWMGDTSGGGFTPDVGQPTGQIDIPNGTTVLRFGGVDTTAFFGTDDTQRLNQNNRDDEFVINLGLPQYIGTSIVMDRVVTANQPAPAGGQATEDTVTFNVEGRLNLFQANTIDGDPTEPIGRFQGPNEGGTTLSVTADENQTTGQVGYIQIGGNATNLTIEVSGDPNAPELARIHSLYVGGETNKVVVNAVGGVRYARFGKGMDTVSMFTRAVEHLIANRGAVGSTVVSSGPIVLATFGGDVVDTWVLSGYFPDSTEDPEFQVGTGGRITTTIAGNIINSFFGASAIPLDADGNITIEDANALLFEEGRINAKHEGFIDNSEELPFAPDQAFFAKHLEVVKGPVVPPNVNEPPFGHASPIMRTQVGLSFRPGPLGHAREATFATPNLLPRKQPHLARGALAQTVRKLPATSVREVVPKGPAVNR